jgi:hypothetical protein
MVPVVMVETAALAVIVLPLVVLAQTVTGITLVDMVDMAQVEI